MSKSLTMDDLLAGKSNIDPIKTGDVITVKVVTSKKNKVWLDLGPHGLGLISRKDLLLGQVLKEGDEIEASVVEPYSDKGFSVLSMRKAGVEGSWDELSKLVEKGEILTVNILDANRGGLIVEYQGNRGFMPVSQLSSEHYPKLNKEDAGEIISHLKKLVGTNIQAVIITADKLSSKLIFSEREVNKIKLSSKLKDLKIGELVDCMVTGVTDFGIFVDIDGIEGMAHISELSWQRIDHPSSIAKIGDKLKLMVLNIDQDRLSLSLKKTQEDPWLAEISKLKIGDIVKGSVTRITPFGAFVQISPSVEALVHISEVSGDSDDRSATEEVFKLGEKADFEVLEINTESRRIALGMAKNSAKSKK
jgi:small subunit ribosomal protein S1